MYSVACNAVYKQVISRCSMANVWRISFLRLQFLRWFPRWGFVGLLLDVLWNSPL